MSRIFSRKNIVISFVVLNLVSFSVYAQIGDSNDSNSLANASKVDSNNLPAAVRTEADSNSQAAIVKTDSNDLGIAAKPVEQSGSNDILKKIPAESLFVLKVNNFDNALSKVDDFIAGVSPMPMGLRVMTRVNFAKALGSAELTGVNMDGDFVLFALPSETSPEPLLFVLVPVTDYQTFVEGNNNLSKDEISIISDNGKPQVYCKNFGNNYALFTKKSEDLSRVSITTEGINSILNAKQIEDSSLSQIWAMGNLQSMNKIFGPLLDAQFEMAKNRIQNPPQRVVRRSAAGKRTTNNVNANAASRKTATNNPNADTTSKPVTSKVNANSTSRTTTVNRNVTHVNKNDVNKQITGVKLYFDGIKRLMSDGKIVTVNINIKSDILKVNTLVAAIPGSKMAESFNSTDPQASNESIIKYLKNGSIFDVAVNTKSALIKALDQTGNDFIFMDETITEADRAKFKDIGKAFSDLTGNGVFSFVPDKVLPVGCRYIIEVKDPNKAEGLVNEFVVLAKATTERKLEINDPNKTNGQAKELEKTAKELNVKKFEVTVEDYNGIKINQVKLGNMSSDPNKPKPQNIDFAIFNNLIVAEFGSEPNVTIKKFIDQVKADNAGEPESEIQTAMGMVPAATKADMLGKMNFVRYVSAIKTVMPFIANQPIDIPQSSSNMVFAIKTDSGSLQCDIALPKEHVTETGRITKIFNQTMSEQRKVVLTTRKAARQKKQAEAAKAKEEASKTKWTCEVHKKVQEDMPGLCPICKRDLIAAGNEQTQNAVAELNNANVNNVTKTAVAVTSNDSDRQKRLNTRATMLKLQMAVLQYKKANGQLPSDLSALNQGKQNADNGAAESPKDGWGNDFVYEASTSYSKGFIIISNGSDNQPGGQGFASDLSTDPIGLKKKQRTEKMQPN